MVQSNPLDWSGSFKLCDHSTFCFVLFYSFVCLGFVQLSSSTEFSLRLRLKTLRVTVKPYGKNGHTKSVVENSRG